MYNTLKESQIELIKLTLNTKRPITFFWQSGLFLLIQVKTFFLATIPKKFPFLVKFLCF